MNFRFSLAGSKAQKVSNVSNLRAEEVNKAREEEIARKRVLAEFLEEHGEDAEGKSSPHPDSSPSNTTPSAFLPQSSKRHFAGGPRSMKSGPGTLEPESGDVSRPGFNNVGTQQPRYGPSQGHSKGTDRRFPTVTARASNLPPGTSLGTVRKLFAKFPALKITDIKDVPPSGPQTGRPSAAMKITFEEGTSIRDLELATNEFNDKLYLTRGYYLHLDRFLSENVSEVAPKLPFGAQWEEVESKGIAPGEDIGRSHPDQGPPKRLVVRVQRPKDLATLRLIHMAVEGVIRGGMEYEAALMEDPRVQSEERFAWLYDQQHKYSPYYRWTIYRLVTGLNEPFELFENCGLWIPPPPIPDEFAVTVADLDPDNEEMEIEEDEIQPGGLKAQVGILYPRSRAQLLWLLCRVPATPAQVCEIAGPTTFCIEHADEDVEEIVELLVTNVFEPFALSKFNSQGRSNISSRQIIETTINAMRILSDLAVTCNARHNHMKSGNAWQYRKLIGEALADRAVFSFLENLPIKLQLGRSSKEQYRKEINYVLEFWMEMKLFDQAIAKQFDIEFNERTRTQQEVVRARKSEEAKARAIAVAKGENVSADDDGLPMDVDEDEASINAELINQPIANDDPHSDPMPQLTPAALPSSHFDSLEETPAARARRMRPKALDFSDEE
ncbi:hypothetical protein B0J11DRAFT_424375 [Dendryphion nanum]|uniref:SURP motif domain-containing protein n=1 Tax=Dendryphion nanum TaxID=256645 RepID=A0A9P9EM53_9PLEO|nr:hypothetical protein B0J11DRAFT_424375 [Dendryphion nanum]